MGYNVTNNNMNIKHELLARHLTAFATENEGRVGDATARFWIGANGPTRKPGRCVESSCHVSGEGQGITN